jgi:hypothetical protein
MRVPGRCWRICGSGATWFEGFVDCDELGAQDALWLHYPRREEHLADPAAHA